MAVVLERSAQHRGRLDQEAEALLVALPLELGFAPGGDVAGDAQHPHRHPVGVPVHLAHGKQPVHRAIGPHHTQLGLVAAALFDGSRDRLADELTIVGVHPDEERLERALELVGREAEQALDVLRPHQLVRGDVPVPDADAPGVDGELEPLFGHSARGQVDEAGDDQLGFSRPSRDRDGLIPQPPPLTVGKRDADEQLLPLTGAQRGRRRLLLEPEVAARLVGGPPPFANGAAPLISAKLSPISSSAAGLA